VKKLNPEIESVSRDGRAKVRFFENLLTPKNKSIPIEKLGISIIRDPNSSPTDLTVLYANFLSSTTFEVQLDFANPLSLSNPVTTLNQLYLIL
jgi:hypothetical protein